MNGQPFGSPRGCWLARPTSGRQLDSFLSLWRLHVGGWSGRWNTLVAMADNKLSALYCSPRGYWKGLAAIQKLASAAKVTEQQVKVWLKRQAIWQIYLPAPRCLPRQKFDVADLLFLPHDGVGRKTFRYALTVVDVASRYKEAEPLTSKTAAEVADALSRIYKRSPLRWPKLLQVDPRREFMGAVSQLLAKHGVEIRRGRVDIHRDQSVSKPVCSGDAPPFGSEVNRVGGSAA